MTGRVKVGGAIAVGVIAVASMGAFLWVKRPFQAELGTYSTSLADRTEAQRHNIRQAALVLDGVIIEPGEIFSFNDAVGPRTAERGYCQAPAYLERDLVTSLGGGICQVSSTIYNAAVVSDLSIVERHSHSRFVASIPPGRDATVWYGVSDLRLKNSGCAPVQLSMLVKNERLAVAFRGARRNFQNIQLRSVRVNSSRSSLQAYRTMRIKSLKQLDEVQETLSNDIYRVD